MNHSINIELARQADVKTDSQRLAIFHVMIVEIKFEQGKPHIYLQKDFHFCLRVCINGLVFLQTCLHSSQTCALADVGWIYIRVGTM